MTTVPSMAAVIASGTIAAGVAAMGMTIISKNPFYGMVAGIAVRLLGTQLGV